MPGLPRLPLVDRRGIVSAFGAVQICVAGLLVSFAAQVSDLYVAKLKQQRAADMAALGAAMGAAPVLSSGAASAAAIATAQNVATLNGFGGASVATTGTALGNGTYTVATAVSTSPSPVMATWIGGASPRVKATGQVLMTTYTVSDCIASLGGTVQISGATSVTGSGCGLGAQSTLAMSGGTASLGSVAVGVTPYAEQPLITGGSLSPNIGSSSFMYNASTIDTAASNAAVQAALAHLQSLATWPYGATIPQTATAKSVVAGAPQAFVSQVATVPANAHWGTLTLTNATLNFVGSGGADPNCTTPTTISGATQLNGSNTLNFASGCYIFGGTVTTDASSSVTNFTINAGASVTLYFQNTLTINLSGGSLNFGNAGLYAFLGNIVQNNNGSTFSVGTGTKIFTGNVTLNGGYMSFGNGNVYMNGTTITDNAWFGSTMQFGNGSFYLWNGSYLGYGNGSTNFGTGPYYFYNSSILNGTAGQGTLYFSGGNYYFLGGSITTGQNVFTTTTFSYGNLDLYNGASISVASPLRVNGSNASGSGTVSVYGGSVSVIGSQALSLAGGTLAMTTGALSVSSGALQIAPPTSSTPSYGYNKLAILSIGGQINLTGGTATIGGMVYAPRSTVTVSNNTTLSYYNNAAYCASITAANVVLSGNSSSSFVPCSGLSASSAGNAIVLDQ